MRFLRAPSGMMLAVLFILRHFLSAHALEVVVNRTVDDTAAEIVYSPSVNWRAPSTSAACNDCLFPSSQLASQQTYHYGINPIPTSDKDDTKPPPDADDGHDDDDSDSSKGKKGKSGSSKNKRGPRGLKRDTDDNPPAQISSNPFDRIVTTNAPDPDDPNFVATSVTATLNFTGSAFYVFCLLPMQNNNASIVSTTNLSFLLDGQPIGTFANVAAPTGPASQFRYNVPVIFQNNLQHAPHTLTIAAQPGSMVLLDYIEYSTLVDEAIQPNGTSVSGGTPSPTSGTQNSSDSSKTSKNTMTFAVAVGSSVGVIGLISLSVAVSLRYRRWKSAKLHRQDDDDDEPEMQGPHAFIPRYFGGAVPANRSSMRTVTPPPAFPDALGDEEVGPSHGLDFMPAPEHIATDTGAPAYTPPPLTLPQTVYPNPVSIPVLVTSRLLSDYDGEASPPRYQDVPPTQHPPMPLFSPPLSTPPLPPPPGFEDVPPRSLSDGDRPLTPPGLYELDSARGTTDHLSFFPPLHPSRPESVRSGRASGTSILDDSADQQPTG